MATVESSTVPTRQVWGLPVQIKQKKGEFSQTQCVIPTENMHTDIQQHSVRYSLGPRPITESVWALAHSDTVSEIHYGLGPYQI